MPETTIERYRYLLERAAKADQAYYGDDDPIMPDPHYDAMMQEIRAIEAEHPDWKAETTPTGHVGTGTLSGSHAKTRHAQKLLSLRDVFTLDDALDWYRNAGGGPVRIEEKIDGLTCMLTYRYGSLDMAATRGDGDVGEDVTENARTIEGIPEHLAPVEGVSGDAILYVRTEAYQPVDAFLRCNEQQEKLGLEPFANPRNCAAGGLRANDPEVTRARGLRAFAFHIMDSPGYEQVRLDYARKFDVEARCPSQQGDMHLLDALGFAPVAGIMAYNETDFLNAVQSIYDVRETLAYWIDGAVAKIDSRDRQDKLGATGKYPLHAVAYKYPAEEKETTVRAIKVQVGRTGVLTPVAEFDPVQIGGSTVSNATCHNQKYLDENHLGVGAVVKVIKSGEIIPKIVGTVKPAPETYKADICPACGASAVERIDKDGKHTGIMVCPNIAGCPAQALRYLEFFCSKDVMDIRGLGPSVLGALWDAELITSVVDIYSLPERQDEIAALEGFGKKKAAGIAASVEKSKHNDIDRFIKALGIPGVGRHIGKMIAKACPDVEDFAVNMSYDRLVAMDGIGEVTARDIRDFWDSQDAWDLYQGLRKAGVNTRSLSYDAPGKTRTDDGPLSGLSIVVTGTIDGYGRADAEDYIAAHGGKASGSVSKKTSYLVAGANAGSKLKKAQDLGVPVITMDELKRMCGE